MAMSSWKSSLHAYGMCTCIGTHQNSPQPPAVTTRPIAESLSALISSEDRAVGPSALSNLLQPFCVASLILLRQSQPASKLECSKLALDHLHNASGVLAGGAVELVLLQVCDGKESALLTHVHPVGVALVEQPLLQPCQRPAVSAQRVSFNGPCLSSRGQVNGQSPKNTLQQTERAK